MSYKKMITDFAEHGGDEKKMWESVAVTSDAMDVLKEVAPKEYECYMRKMAETLYGKHYTEELALADVAEMHCTDANGAKHHGAHWTVDEVEKATADKTFGKSVTKWDKYVAYNATWCDLSSEFNDEDILCIAYKFWFADEDWKSQGKIWDYMAANK